MGIFFENEYTSNKEHNYGVPELKDFPLDTNEDIQKAIKDFHKCPKKYKEELAINIIRRLMQLDNTADPIDVDKEGYFYKYYKEHSRKIKSIVKEDTIQEKALSSQERKELPDSEFGIPELRKYPLTDKEHVEQAIRYFNKCPKGYEKELATNIKKKIVEYDMKPNIGDNNNFKNYYNESTISTDILNFLKGSNDELLDPLPIEEKGKNVYKDNSINENYVLNNKDIYYNKEKFDNGEINLCFITGLSGSGKTTMANNMEKDNIEHYQLDDLLFIKDHFTMQDLEQYGDLIYSFFKGEGKEFYLSLKEVKEKKIPGSKYEDKLFPNFVHYAMKYSKMHKNKKFIIEGVWLFYNGENGSPYFEPSEFKNYAFYIKGTSMIISKHRASLRDAKYDSSNKKEVLNNYINNFVKRNWSQYKLNEKRISKFRNYFNNLINNKNNSINEAVKHARDCHIEWEKENHYDPYEDWTNESTVITEETNPSNQIIIDKPKNVRKYKCPYCNNRYERAKLVTHIDRVHEDMIPEGYTAARIVFNMINHKEVGHCVVCGKETEWNENTWRYERFCSEKCVNEYKKTAKARMVKKYGKEHLLNDMEQQKKMLSNRRISGEYKWSDGELREYVGSYEKKLLEFLDKVMNYKSSEVITPGPTVDYEFEGKIHHWILDMYIVPARLAIDVKDGGDNPNNRDMPEYRAKQVAKEKAIKDLNKFNYLRLTNNNFTQLLELLVELKENMKDDINEPIIRIHELMAPGAINPPMGLDSADGFIVPCMMNNTFVDYVYTTDKYCQDIYKIEDNKIKKITRKELETLYEFHYLLKYNKDDIIEKNKIIKEAYENNTDVQYDFFYNTLVGDNNSDIIYNESFDYTLDGIKESRIRLSITESTFNHQYKKSLGKDIYFPILNPEELQIKDRILNGIGNIDIMTDENGYFLIDKQGNSRTLSFDKLSNIDIDYLYTFYNMLKE